MISCDQYYVRCMHRKLDAPSIEGWWGEWEQLTTNILLGRGQRINFIAAKEA